MSFKFIITFFIGLGVYLAIIGVITLVKFLRNKKKYEKELDEAKSKENEVKEVVNDGEENKDNDNNA